MPVYADVLFVLNGFINYLLLICNKRILKLNTGPIKLLLGVILGSLVSLKIFLPDFSMFTEFVIRLVSVFLIVLTSYNIRTTKVLIKAVIGFLCVNLIFSGIMIAIILFFNPPDLIYDNGVVYYTIDFLNILILSVISFALISLGEKILKSKTNRNLLYETTIYFSDKSVTGRGFHDTGNVLKEPFSGFPVVVAEYNFIKPLLSENIKKYIKEGSIESVSEGKVRLIPVSTVSGVGMMPAFLAEKLKIRGSDCLKERENIYVAVSENKLCGGEFDIILNNSISEVD